MSNKLKIVVIICMLILSSFLEENVALAKEYNYEEIQISESRMEEYIWYYRMVNGREQKRLWSLTRGYWVSDWEWV